MAEEKAPAGTPAKQETQGSPKEPALDELIAKALEPLRRDLAGLENKYRGIQGRVDSALGKADAPAVDDFSLQEENRQLKERLGAYEQRDLSQMRAEITQKFGIPAEELADLDAKQLKTIRLARAEIVSQPAKDGKQPPAPTKQLDGSAGRGTGADSASNNTAQDDIRAASQELVGALGGTRRR